MEGVMDDETGGTTSVDWDEGGGALGDDMDLDASMDMSTDAGRDLLTLGSTIAATHSRMLTTIQTLQLEMLELTTLRDQIIAEGAAREIAARVMQGEVETLRLANSTLLRDLASTNASLGDLNRTVERNVHARTLVPPLSPSLSLPVRVYVHTHTCTHA
jgi:hypothetical protein